MSATVRLALVPRDGLFVKDGRGWHTSASGRGHAIEWPWPSTLLGALRTAWGRQEEATADRAFTAGDWRARTSAVRLDRALVLRRSLAAGTWTCADRVWPAPMDALLLQDRHEVCRLDPGPHLTPTLGRDDDETREALWVAELDEASKPRAAPRWWSEARFAAWLAGRSVPAHDPANTFDLARRAQVHVGIRPERLTADEGVLFSHDIFETLEPGAEWAAGIEATLPCDHALRIATLGADGRLAAVERLPADLFAPPTALTAAFQHGRPGLRIVLVSPACFTRGWLPDGLEARDGTYLGRIAGLDHEVVLRAALTQRPVHISGWDMACGRPKPTARLVPAGSVYFFERTDGQPFEASDANRLWCSALGARTDEGFGRVVAGIWIPRGER